MMKALTIKQPWAWLIIHGGKDVENRSRRTHLRGRIYVHASKTMTREDYEACVIFCSGLDVTAFPENFCFPSFEDLQSQLGGIVGGVEIADCVEESESPWFVGDFGYVLKNAEPLPFQSCRGYQNFFVPEFKS